MTLDRVERRLLREYLDLPGLSLSLTQAARLLCVDEPTCRVLLHELAADRVELTFYWPEADRCEGVDFVVYVA
jgi:hypothetical protein